MSTRNSDSSPQSKSPSVGKLRQLGASIIMMAKTPVIAVRNASNRLFGSPASSQDRTGDRAAARAQDHESEVRVSSNEGREMEQDREIEGSRTEMQIFPTNHGNRRMSIVPNIATGVPPRESDRFQQSVQPEREEDRQDSEIVHKAVELTHITKATAKLFLDPEVTEDRAYDNIIKQLRHWQDKDVMSAYSKQRMKEVTKGTGFRAQDRTESLYRFLETTARNDVVAGFLLKNLRPVCASEVENEIAVVMREACTRVWH